MEPSSSRGIMRTDSTNEYSSQFKATQTWNKIAREFREKMPTKKRWRQLRSFENSFTGKEAADFIITILPSLLPNKKEITRESCVALLQKFADNNLFKYAWTGDKTVFQDNATLYVWNGDTTLNGVCRTPVLMRRASSFHNGSIDRTRRVVPTITPKPADIPSPDTWKTFELPKSPPKHKPCRNRRLSSSTGNLSLIGIEKFESVLSPRPGDSIRGAPIMEEGVITPDKNEYMGNIDYGEIRRDSNKENIYGELRKKKMEPIYVMPKEEQRKFDDNSPPVPTLVKSPLYASFTQREERIDYDKENKYEYVTFRRKNPNHNTPSKGSKRGVQAAKEKKDNESSQMKSVISRLTPSRFKGKECELKEVSPLQPPAPPPTQPKRRGEPTIYSSIRIRPKAEITDNDEWNIYSTALSNRVRSLMGIIDESERDSVITWRVDGQHVKWSCKYHPIGKVVRAMKQYDDWPNGVTQQMEYLKYFPFHSKNSSVITYTEKLEVKVFRTVVGHLSKNVPLLEAAVGHSILRVIDHFKKIPKPISRPNSANSVRSVRQETDQSDCSTTTKMLSQNSSSSLNGGYVPKEEIYATPIPFQARAAMTGDTVALIDSSPIPTTLTHRHNLHSTPPQGPLRVDPKSGIKARDILMAPLGDRILRLPGLKHSPDLIERIKNLTPRVSAIPFPMDTSIRSSDGYSIPPVIVSSLMDEISLEMQPAVYETLQLILLSLPVGTRRKLQLLIKFMNDISANHCLTLDDQRENRYVALCEFCDCILASTDDYSMDSPLSHSDRINLVSMLVDNESRLFRIPDDFESRVENVLMERRRAKREYDDNSPTIAPSAPTFCQRIQPEIYSAQMNDTNYSLRSLLDDIVSNSRMTHSEREKKLKAFEKSHPSIFYEKFPDRLQKKQEGGFLSKIFRSRND